MCLKSTFDKGLAFKSACEAVKLKSFMNANYSGDRDNMKSTFSYMFTLCDFC